MFLWSTFHTSPLLVRTIERIMNENGHIELTNKFITYDISLRLGFIILFIIETYSSALLTVAIEVAHLQAMYLSAPKLFP